MRGYDRGFGGGSGRPPRQRYDRFQEFGPRREPAPDRGPRGRDAGPPRGRGDGPRMDRHPQGGGGPRGFDPWDEHGSAPRGGGGQRYDRDERFGPGDRAFGWDDPRDGVFGYAESDLSDDVELEQSVRMSLFLDTWLDADRIEVEVDDGVATLTGEVEDHLQARYAWDDAWETEGVRGVISRLEVRAAEEDSDRSDPEDGSPNESPDGKPVEDKA
jgi:hypothetical protein